MTRNPLRATWALLSLAALFATTSGQATTTITLKPGLWAVNSEVWIDGQSVSASLNARRQAQRARMSEAQRKLYDREMAKSNAQCVPADQATIDVQSYIEQSLRQGGPWTCTLSQERLESERFTADYHCSTAGGGQQNGQASAHFNSVSYRLELKGRGHVVHNTSGEVLDPNPHDGRLLATGNWTAARCTP
jgi:hypothetical protein